MDREHALAYLASFDVDVSLLGEAVAAGRQHTVFRYGEHQCLKLPNRSLYMKIYGALDCEIVKRDVELLQRYLPDCVPPTEVLHSRVDADDYLILQTYIHDARFLDGFSFPHVRDQFAQVVACNRTLMRKHGLSIDFFGNIGFRQSLWAAIAGQTQRALLNNVMVTEADGSPRIIITDTNLSELRLALRADVQVTHWMIDTGVFLMTRWMLWRLFGVKV